MNRSECSDLALNLLSIVLVLLEAARAGHGPDT